MTKSRKKKPKPVKVWAVCDSAGNPYLDPVSSTKGLAIDADTIRRGHDWTLCQIEDGAICWRITITIKP